MSILAGFKDVKPGVSYGGVMIKYIAMDTNKRFHLMPFNSWSEPARCVAVLAANTTITTETTSKERADILWLWENVVA